MSIDNQTLSSTGFTVTPRPFDAPILPQHGRDLCTPSLLRHSPPPRLLGTVPDLTAFSLGDDIDVGGMVIKPTGRKKAIVPVDLRPFYGVLEACISNEFACDPHAKERTFALTITRCTVKEGQSNRPSADHWHRHWPSERMDRAAQIQTTRNYVVADNDGTEFYAGSMCGISLPNPNLRPTHRLGAGEIGAFASPSLHRCPTLKRGGRRTVLIFISYAPKAEGSRFSNPALDRLTSCDKDERMALLVAWRLTERTLARPTNFIRPPYAVPVATNPFIHV